MKILTDYIGKEFRRTTISIQHNGDYYVAFAVLELLESDMQDVNDFPASPNGNPWIKRADATSANLPYNAYMTVDNVVLAKDFLDHPIDNYVINNQKLKFFGSTISPNPSDYSNSILMSDSFHDDAPTIQQILPLRQCSKFLNAYIDKDKAAQKIVLGDVHLQKQLSQLSTEHYGADLTLYPEHLGNIYIVRYNPYFRTVDYSSSSAPAGLFCKFRFRPSFRGELRMRITNKTRAGFYLSDQVVPIEVSRSDYFIDMPLPPEILDIKIYDAESMVYYYDDIRFLQKIQFDMNIKSSDLKLRTESEVGVKEEEIEKFVSQRSAIGETPEREAALGETMTANAYKMLEQRLEFVLFDGDKTKREQNVAKARKMVKEILSKAHQRCIICDPYFGLKDMIDFVFTMPQLSVPVRVLASQEFLGKNAVESKAIALQLSESIEKFNNRVGAMVQMRLLSGRSPLHDRFIVIDDMVWLLGSSFNEFGNRASTITKVPQVSCRQLYTLAEQWWSDDTFSKSLKEYGNQ